MSPHKGKLLNSRLELSKCGFLTGWIFLFPVFRQGAEIWFTYMCICPTLSHLTFKQINQPPPLALHVISNICLQPIHSVLWHASPYSPLLAARSWRSQDVIYSGCWEALLEMHREVTQMKSGGKSRSGWKTSWSPFPRVGSRSVCIWEHGLNSTLACQVTLVGCVTLSDLRFLICATKGVLNFSDPSEALGGGNKLMFGKACVTLGAKTLSKYKVNYRDCLLSH